MNYLNGRTLSLRILEFLRWNWGNLASVAGLVVAGISAYFAKRASTAAKEARQAILSNSLTEEINVAHKLAVEINTLIDIGKHELARLRCNDLHDRAITLLKRWDLTLSTDSKNNLLIAKAQLESLSAVASKLAVAVVAPTGRQLSQMRGSCAKIREIFVEEHASAMRRIDEADNA